MDQLSTFSASCPEEPVTSFTLTLTSSLHDVHFVGTCARWRWFQSKLLCPRSTGRSSTLTSWTPWLGTAKASRGSLHAASSFGQPALCHAAVFYNRFWRGCTHSMLRANLVVLAQQSDRRRSYSTQACRATDCTHSLDVEPHCSSQRDWIACCHV